MGHLTPVHDSSMGKKRANAQDRRQKRAQKKEKVKKKVDKLKAKAEGSGGGDDDQDLDALLQEFAKMDASVDQVKDVVCSPPSARAAATLVAHPTNKDEIILYGGEYNNGSKTIIYNGKTAS